MLALEVVTAITMLISVVTPTMIVVTAIPNVAMTSKVITVPVVMVVITSWRVQCFTGALVQ
jgi:hypothetical protein